MFQDKYVSVQSASFQQADAEKSGIVTTGEELEALFVAFPIKSYI